MLHIISALFYYLLVQQPAFFFGGRASSKMTWLSNVAAILRDDWKSRDSEACTEEVDILIINIWMEVLLHKKT